MELAEIKQRVVAGQIRLSDALARSLPKFRGLVTDDTLEWCSNELQGYSNALEFYQKGSTTLPHYRVVNGTLKIVHANGTFGEINHPLATRSEFFLAAPLQWLEDFFGLPGDTAIVDLPELTNYIGRQLGGTIICECPRVELQHILESFHEQFISIIDQVVAAKEQRRTGAQQAPQAQWGGFGDAAPAEAPSFAGQAAPVWVPDDEGERAPSAFDLAQQSGAITGYPGYTPPQTVQEAPTKFIGGAPNKTPSEQSPSQPSFSSLRNTLAPAHPDERVKVAPPSRKTKDFIGNPLPDPNQPQPAPPISFPAPAAQAAPVVPNAGGPNSTGWNLPSQAPGEIPATPSLFALMDAAEATKAAPQELSRYQLNSPQAETLQLDRSQIPSPSGEGTQAPPSRPTGVGSDFFSASKQAASQSTTTPPQAAFFQVPARPASSQQVTIPPAAPQQVPPQVPAFQQPSDPVQDLFKTPEAAVWAPPPVVSSWRPELEPAPAPPPPPPPPLPAESVQPMAPTQPIWTPIAAPPAVPTNQQAPLINPAPTPPAQIQSPDNAPSEAARELYAQLQAGMLPTPDAMQWPQALTNLAAQSPNQPSANSPAQPPVPQFTQPTNATDLQQQDFAQQGLPGASRIDRSSPPMTSSQRLKVIVTDKLASASAATSPEDDIGLSAEQLMSETDQPTAPPRKLADPIAELMGDTVDEQLSARAQNAAAHVQQRRSAEPSLSPWAGPKPQGDAAAEPVQPAPLMITQPNQILPAPAQAETNAQQQQIAAQPPSVAFENKTSTAGGLSSIPADQMAQANLFADMLKMSDQLAPNMFPKRSGSPNPSSQTSESLGSTPTPPTLAFPKPPGAPSTPAPLAAPSTPAPLAAPSTPAPLATPSTPAPLAAPSTPAPLAAPSTPAPLAAPSTPTPLAAPSTPAPLAAPSTPAPLAAPSTAAPPVPPPATLQPQAEPAAVPTGTGSLFSMPLANNESSGQPSNLFADMLKASQLAPQTNPSASQPTAENSTPSVPGTVKAKSTIPATRDGVNWAATPTPTTDNGQPSFTPVIGGHIKIKASQLMIQAYGTKDLYIATTDLVSTDQATRDSAIGALDYMVKMNWVRMLGPNLFMLSKDGISEVERSLAF